MPLLQTVTSLLLLHFSRFFSIRSRGSSSFFYKKMGEKAFLGLPDACDRYLATFIFTVTTVTNKNKNLLKISAGKDFGFVTAAQKTAKAVTNLLQSVTICNNNCYKICNKIINCISCSYMICNSEPSKNPYLRIFHRQNKNRYYNGY